MGKSYTMDRKTTAWNILHHRKPHQGKYYTLEKNNNYDTVKVLHGKKQLRHGEKNLPCKTSS